MRRFAVSLSLIALMWAVDAGCLLTGAHPREALGYNLPADEHLCHFLTAGLTVAHPWTLAVFTVAAVMLSLIHI